MAHYDRTELPDLVPILAAGVGEYMIRAVGKCADGFVGHTIASADNLRDGALPLLVKAAAETGRTAADLRHAQGIRRALSRRIA